MFDYATMHTFIEHWIAYRSLDITRKDVLSLEFYFKWKYFILIDHILSETIVFSVSVFLFSNLRPKIKFCPKIGLTYAIYIVKYLVWKFFPRKCVLLFFAELDLLMFHNNIVKISS